MPLDGNSAAPLIDHIGVRLWKLAWVWKAQFDSEMLERGYPWVSEARSAVLGHLRPGGRPQAELASTLKVSKQAIQQFVDALVAEGAVERLVDRKDARGRVVRLTKRGIAFMEEGNAVKRKIEARYAKQIGQAQLDALNATLDRLLEANDHK